MRYTICRIARRCYKVFTTHGQEREREAVTMSDYAAIEKEARIFTEECVTNNRIDPTLFAQYDIKRGLRDKNGKGVLAGITNISRIDAFEERDGQKVPCEGKLWYRGYNVYDLIRGLRGQAAMRLRARPICCYSATCRTKSSSRASPPALPNAATCRQTLCATSS